jgi:hypothetical protein
MTLSDASRSTSKRQALARALAGPVQTRMAGWLALRLVDGCRAELCPQSFLSQFLQEQQLFEETEEALKREEVLGRLDAVVKRWIKAVAAACGMATSTAQEANAKIFTFGSYRLGVHAPGARECCCADTCLGCRTHHYSCPGTHDPNVPFSEGHLLPCPALFSVPACRENALRCLPCLHAQKTLSNVFPRAIWCAAGADIDVLCVGPAYAKRDAHFFGHQAHCLEQILTHTPGVTEVQAVPKAYVPLLKVKVRLCCARLVSHSVPAHASCMPETSSHQPRPVA